MIKQKAKEFDVDIDWAFDRKRRFYCGKERALGDYLKTMDTLFRESSIEKEKAFIIDCCNKVRKERRDVEKKKKYLKVEEISENENTIISDTMIELAKKVPFTSLISVVKGNKAYCPFHEEKNPSFHIYKNNNTGYCFSCHRNFDTIQFIIDSKKVNFSEAVKYLYMGG